MRINVFGRTARQINKGVIPNEIKYGYGEQPDSEYGRRLLRSEKYAKFLDMTNSQLLDIMWGRDGLGVLDSLGSSDLRKILETHWRNRTGTELSINMPDSYWTSSRPNNRDGMLNKIQDIVQRSLEIGGWAYFDSYQIDCSSILDQANINFRTDIKNPSLAIPMGGVQEVVLRTVKVEEKEHHRPLRPNLMGFSVKSHKDYLINLEIKLRDRFAVSEDDFTTNSLLKETGKTIVTALGRDALTAFWILQHQRNYRPFVWNAIFKSNIRVHQPTGNK